MGSTVTDRFKVLNGLKHGCTLAPHYLVSTLVLWWLIGAIGVVVQE